ncbi:hypothetical protein SEA_BRAN_54 [Corynebacterium phage Bran]|nr:hypothetical protein SEA_BRAN_54 [Corynebacterium phage Bran]
MSTLDICWDGTGKQAAEIVQHLRRDGYSAAFTPGRREIVVIDRAGTLTRITPPDPCDTCTLRDHWCCDPWENRDEHEGDTQ